jgi:hypothetical protein
MFWQWKAGKNTSRKLMGKQNHVTTPATNTTGKTAVKTTTHVI